MPTSHPISNKLIAWYKVNKRDLPWRNTTDPYKIWLSEIMLQQTQVAQGLNYYIKFTNEFATVNDLADAPEDKVMLLWQGLGYYSRARNLHSAAKQIKNEFNGKFPTQYADIKNLKGVGDYTAAAIASIAFNLPYAVVDGNVYRVLSRLFNEFTPINTNAGKKIFQQLANEILNVKEPLLHNNAIMEFGALLCKPQQPKCPECPLKSNCLAFEKKTTTQLPVKNKTIKIKSRYFNYLVLNYKDKLYIKKRTEKDIWQNMYEFYLIESPEEVSNYEDLMSDDLKKALKKHSITLITSVQKHILSHQHIYTTFYEIQLSSALKIDDMISINRADIQTKAFPQLIIKYLLGNNK